MLGQEEKNSLSERWLLKIAIIFFVISLLTLFAFWFFDKTYQNKIYPGLYLGKINLSGLSAEEARTVLNQKINSLGQNGVAFFYKEHRAVLLPTIASADAELAYTIINFNSAKTIEEALSYGRSDSLFLDLQNKLKAIIFGRAVNLVYSINETEVKKVLDDNFSQFEAPAEDARLVFSGKEEAPIGKSFTVAEERLGAVIDYLKAIEQLKINLTQLNDSNIELTTVADYPKIYKKEVFNLNNKINKILIPAPLTLKYKETEWLVGKNQLAGWLALKINPQASNYDDKIVVGFNDEAVKKFLEEKVAPAINKKPAEAKFKIKDGKVSEFQNGEDGLELDAAGSLAQIENEFIANKKNTVGLAVNELKSLSQVEETNDFGIKEIIGTGASNFTGSPTNRRRNIKVGADTLNGLLIKPGEEFSLLKALGAIDAAAGYLPELVIKGNKTVPEFGGGLCQIGTTMFRAALASGLPITARRSHSYRVVYYEPAGTDATIYNPAPDLKFINDTGNYILIQARIEKDNLYFDFWGTGDGRVATQTKPVIYNIVKPGPTKIIKTADLPVDTKKCTEKAHNGADAYFDYKVTYADGRIEEKRFSSHYIPWQEVCLLGVEKSELATDGLTAASSTKP